MWFFETIHEEFLVALSKKLCYFTFRKHGTLQRELKKSQKRAVVLSNFAAITQRTLQGYYFFIFIFVQLSQKKRLIVDYICSSKFAKAQSYFVCHLKNQIQMQPFSLNENVVKECAIFSMHNSSQNKSQNLSQYFNKTRTNK